VSNAGRNFEDLLANGLKAPLLPIVNEDLETELKEKSDRPSLILK
jgi:hypothetical protein